MSMMYAFDVMLSLVRAAGCRAAVPRGILMSGQYRAEAVRTAQPSDRAGGALGGSPESRLAKWRAHETRRCAVRAAGAAAVSL